MSKRILITGGAGFVGSHLADALLARGHQVCALDNLCAQVHGPDTTRPDYLDPAIDLRVGDVRDPAAVAGALEGVDVVYHFAAMVGVGQSMYEVSDYTDVNNRGTAVLLEALVKRPPARLIVASSMSVYGEGLYRTDHGSLAVPVERTAAQLKAGDWEVRNRRGEVLVPVPTPETRTPTLRSVYALSKYDQERMCLLLGEAYHIPTVALRLFNIYGPRQALSNPYTGVLAIFASRLLNGNPPLLFEDGQQRRDFVSVHDVVQACLLALETPEAAGQVFNIGSGESYTVREVARRLALTLGRPEIAPVVTGTYRVGDIRHCFADITRARQVLGYSPRIRLEAGLVELSGWLEGRMATDRVVDTHRELAARGLTVTSARVPGTTPVVRGHLRQHREQPVLITGGAGFIGTNLATRCLEAGRHVLLYDNLSRPGVDENLRWLKRAYGDRVELVRADVRDAETLSSCVARASQVFHLAAQVAVTTSLRRPLEDFEINARGTLNLLEALRQLGRPVPLVFSSTNKVYGALDDLPVERGERRYLPEPSRAAGIDEGRPLDFHSPYGCSKGAADQYVLDYARTWKLPAVVFRMSCIYGPHQCGTEDQGWVAHFTASALDGQPITLYGDGLQVRDVLYVDDLIDAFVLAQVHMDRLAGQAFNLGGGPDNTLSLLELVDLLGELDREGPALQFGPWRQGDQRYYVSDIRRFQHATGWRPHVDPRAGLGRLYDWMLETRLQQRRDAAGERAR